MDMEEEEENISGQVHGGEQSAKQKKRKYKKEKKYDQTVSKETIKPLTSPCIPKENSPSKKRETSYSSSTSFAGSSSILFSGRNPKNKFKLVAGTLIQPILDLPAGQGVLSVELEQFPSPHYSPFPESNFLFCGI